MVAQWLIKIYNRGCVYGTDQLFMRYVFEDIPILNATYVLHRRSMCGEMSIS